MRLEIVNNTVFDKEGELIDKEKIEEAIKEAGLAGREFLVVDEDGRQEKAKEYIEQSAWAFDASFLASQTGIPQKMFEALQPECENGNDAILEAIEATCGIDEFVEAAVSADGYGHFLSQYDGVEHEIDIDGETLYVYRQA